MCICILQAIDELLSYGADPSLVLTHGVGSALCVASSTEHEERRSIEGRIKLVHSSLLGLYSHQISYEHGLLRVTQ